ncbi:MAG: inorganic phosphate transporter, partial [Bacteroidota bacterium]
MENIYLFIVVLLFVLAISDLIVGVSNDAVNFLNSAFGSRAASFRTIMIIAALGILVGAVFSGGMMEVARKGIFKPGMFYFPEIMLIFLAVMATDILLLDLFNTFGLPTSTTVSIVFELLGAAVGIALIKVSMDTGIGQVSDFINSSNALFIISGILLSVAVSFFCGWLVQFFTRILFSFNYKKYLKYFGSVFGGLAITAILFFLLLKGAKGATFMTNETVNFIKSNTFSILLINFLAWSLVLQLLYSL